MIPLLMKWRCEVLASPLQGSFLSGVHTKAWWWEQHPGLRPPHWLPLHPDYFIRQSELPGVQNAQERWLRSCEALTLMRASLD